MCDSPKPVSSEATLKRTTGATFNSRMLQLPYLLDCKPRLTQFFFHHFVRLTMKGGLTIEGGLHYFSLAHRKV